MIRSKDRCEKNEPKYHREIKRDNDKYREIKRRDYDQKMKRHRRQCEKAKHSWNRNSRRKE